MHGFKFNLKIDCRVLLTLTPAFTEACTGGEASGRIGTQHYDCPYGVEICLARAGEGLGRVLINPLSVRRYG
jgi:hypothetical protein